MAGLPTALANVLVILGLTLEIRDGYWRGGTGFWSAGPLLACALGYMVYAMPLLLAGWALKRLHHLATALILFLLALIKVFTADTQYVFMMHEQTILNLRFAVLAAAIVFLTLAALIVRRKPVASNVFSSPGWGAAYVLIAHALVRLALTLETATFFSH